MTNNNAFITELFKAYQNNSQISQDSFPEKITTLEEAYEIQHQLTQLKEEAGEKLVGYKIMAHDGELLYGQLTSRSLIKKLELKQANLPKLELELVFIAKEDLSVKDSDEKLLSKLKVAAGFEIPDTRYEGWPDNLNNCQILADGATNGGQVNGQEAELSGINLKEIKGQVLKDGQEFAKGHKENALEALKWLIFKLNTQNLQIKKGMFVTSGTLFPPQELVSGKYIGEIENVGSVTFEVI